MSSPAERYAAAKLRQQESKSVLAKFRENYEFELDDFQVAACKSLEQGFGVLVAAPTGAGKTVVGEFAIYLGQQQSKKTFYTTPIKALSNQKFNELVERYGSENVGLLTGDVSVNGEAPIVVMTTEVLRNMLYVGSSTLLNLGHVVMDEVHYLADRSRGAVWEEVILRLPESVAITALSATVSNAEEFGAWLESVRGNTDVVVEEHRPVPLWQLVAAENKLHDLFIDESQKKVNSELIRLARQQQQLTRPGNRNRRNFSRFTPYRDSLIKLMDSESLLPAIWFIFSRKGCDQAVDQMLSLNLRLTNNQEAQEIREYAESEIRDLPGADLVALEADDWLQALTNGYAAHHAGLIPRFKIIVENLFQRGLLKVVFATETLALGINMPARSVVLEKLSKWNGDGHVNLTAGEYTQLTGRAGRRGIDDEGNAIVLWQDDLDPLSLAGLASTRTYPLKSSFKPGYTMAVNTIENIGYDRTAELIGFSFAQYQADAGVLGLNAKLEKQQSGLAGYRESMECHLGDFFEYAELRERLSQTEKTAASSNRQLIDQMSVSDMQDLEPGDVVLIQAGRKTAPAVVLEVLMAFGEDPRAYVLTINKEVRKVRASDFAGEIRPLTRIKIPQGFDSRSNKAKALLINKMRQHAYDVRPPRVKAPKNHDVENQISMIRSQIKSHPCHGCDKREDHARWGERFFKLKREIDALENQISTRTNVLTREFRQVSEVLVELGYLDGIGQAAKVTQSGQLLRNLHSENALLLAEGIQQKIFDGLAPAELAAVVSSLVFEPRKDEPEGGPRIKSANVVDGIQALSKLFVHLREVEARHRLNTVSKPEAGFAWPIYLWVEGKPLNRILHAADMSAGDFVRTSRRLVDVLEQIGAVTGGETRDNANAAVLAIRRGIVDTDEINDQ